MNTVISYVTITYIDGGFKSPTELLNYINDRIPAIYVKATPTFLSPPSKTRNSYSIVAYINSDKQITVGCWKTDSCTNNGYHKSIDVNRLIQQLNNYIENVILKTNENRLQEQDNSGRDTNLKGGITIEVGRVRSTVERGQFSNTEISC